MRVKKNTGHTEEFSSPKFLNSLLKSGADQEMAKDIFDKIKGQLNPGISTKKIYRMALRQLRRQSKKIAAYYSINKAILDLGPEGYLFEKFIAALFESMGFKANVGVHLKGKCVTHEVDVVAIGDQKILVECKFHNSTNFKSSIKTALYVSARKMDLRENKENTFDDFWLVTNTKFSTDAITYAECVGLKLLGKNYPTQNVLGDFVIKYRLFPITCLVHLRKKNVRKLIQKNIFLCKDIFEKPALIDNIGMEDVEKKLVLKEIADLCEDNKGQN